MLGEDRLCEVATAFAADLICKPGLTVSYNCHAIFVETENYSNTALASNSSAEKPSVKHRHPRLLSFSTATPSTWNCELSDHSTGNMSIAHTTAYTLGILTFGIIFVPVLWLFLSGIESGMDHVDRVYPYPQPRKPFHEHPVLIYVHMYSNIMASAIQWTLLALHPPVVSKRVHATLAWTYTPLVIVGSTAAIAYASQQDYGNDRGKSGTFAFSVMAFVTLSSLATTHYYMHLHRDPALHREWAIRNFAILFGNGVIFRLLANTYLVWMTDWGCDFYATWCQMIYLAWIVPLLVAEQYLGWERSRRLDKFSAMERERENSGKTVGVTGSKPASSVPFCSTLVN